MNPKQKGYFLFAKNKTKKVRKVYDPVIYKIYYRAKCSCARASVHLSNQPISTSNCSYGGQNLHLLAIDYSKAFSRSQVLSLLFV